jgi:hypothetical protein
VNAELKHELWLNRCLLEKGADFSGAKSTHLLSFDGSKVTGKFDMDSSRIDESVNMRNARFYDITMASAHIGDTLELNESTVTGQLYMDKLRVDSSLLMRDAHFGEVVLGSAHIGGTLELDNSKVTRRLYMDKLQVDSSFFMRSGEFEEVVLGSAHIGSMFTLYESKVSKELHMDKLRVDSSLSMRNAKFADVNLTSVHVGGQLQMHDAVFGTLQCYNLAVDQDALLHNSHFTGKTDCPFSKFRNLYLDNSIFDDDVNLTSAQIGGELQLGQHSAHWSPDKWLILRNARAETIPMLTDAWPEHLDLNGFTYRTLRDDSPLSHKRTSECPSGLLKCWFAKQKSFSPQPYEQLALVFQNQGYADDARAIRYAGRERERSESGGLRYAWLTTLDWAIGYGHQIERALGWTIGLIFLGAIVLRISGEGPKHGLPVGLSYSFDMLLPIIKLRDAHYEIDLKGWPRYYFYVHKVAGFVLASFLVAGISGLTK